MANRENMGREIYIFLFYSSQPKSTTTLKQDNILIYIQTMHKLEKMLHNLTGASIDHPKKKVKTTDDILTVHNCNRQNDHQLPFHAFG